MIKYNLICNKKHEFESWFSNSNEFEKLKKKKLLECIFCNSKEIKKSIMAPRVIVTKNIDIKKTFPKRICKIKKDLVKIKKFVEKNFEFVGDRFSHEARKFIMIKKKIEIFMELQVPKNRKNYKKKVSN